MSEPVVVCPLGRCVICNQTGLVARDVGEAALRRLGAMLVELADDGPDWEWLATHGDG